jgi:hypothetical protein
LVAPSRIRHAITSVSPKTMCAWQHALGPPIIASEIARNHSTPATQTALDHEDSPLMDNQCASGKGYVGEPRSLAEFNLDTRSKSSVVLIRAVSVQSQARR